MIDRRIMLMPNLEKNPQAKMDMFEEFRDELDDYKRRLDTISENIRIFEDMLKYVNTFHVFQIEKNVSYPRLEWKNKKLIYKESEDSLDKPLIETKIAIRESCFNLLKPFMKQIVENL